MFRHADRRITNSSAWEQVKLKDVAIYIRGSFPQPYTNPDFYDELNGKPFVQVADIGFNLKLNPDTRAHISKLAENKSRFVEAGKVVVALQGSIEKSIGRTAITQYDAFFDRTILIFQSYKIPMNDRYFAQVIERLFEYEKEKAWGATISTITKEKLNDFIIGVTDLREQIEIGEFFQKLDQAITLQQRRLELLRKLKQGYLQQLFPSKDKYLPRLRFKEFNGDWKQCTIGEIFTERTERSGEGELISVTINSGVVKASELDRKDNSSKNKSNYKKVEIGDIAYNSMRMWQGASGYSPYKGILSPAYTVITPKNEIDSEFFSYDFKRFNMIQAFKRNSQGLTSDTWNLKFPTLKSIKINVPHFDEQRRISNTFNQVDNMLLLQQTKINQLNKLKQAYLQKLFP
ncbi:restriction endonuclease subunit S [Lactobacillus curvatus]|nr:restriction endonuclease subunit S [Latilactobacillus curvatus]MSE22902.1 restriction endonuclease subunit S [Latilactobacillus curvatus]